MRSPGPEMPNGPDEPDEPLARAYALRTADPAVLARDSVLDPATAHMLAERQRVMWGLLREAGWTAATLPTRRVLEIGCGDGGNLLDLLRGGCNPAGLTGVEHLPARAAQARARLPAAATVIEGDAADAAVRDRLGAGAFDAVLLFTVLSSVPDPAARAALAETAWRATAPGGLVLVYDFIVDNPRNPAVRRVPVAELRALWPQAGRVRPRRLTLAPPIARALGPAVRWAYGPLAAVPGLCLHRMTALHRPAG